MWADAGRDNSESAADQYHIRSAALTLTKTAAVISDPFNGTGTDRKAIPGAVIEYTIVVTNNSTTTAADAVTVTDNIPANTTFLPGSITLNAGALPDTNFIAGSDAASGGQCRRCRCERRRGDGHVPSDDQQLIDAQPVIADCDTQRGRGGE